MYGKVLGAGPVATGIALLPETGSNRVLFVTAASLLALGVVIFAVSTLMARKSRQQA